MKRDSFVVYKSFYLLIKLLDKTSQLKVYDAMFKYGIDGVEPDFSEDETLNAIWSTIMPQIKANNKRYENGLKGAEFGVLGGRPKKEINANTVIEKNGIGDIKENGVGVIKKTPNDTKNKTPKITPNENVNENDNVNVNDNYLNNNKKEKKQIQDAHARELFDLLCKRVENKVPQLTFTTYFNTKMVQPICIKEDTLVLRALTSLPVDVYYNYRELINAEISTATNGEVIKFSWGN